MIATSSSTNFPQRLESRPWSRAADDFFANNENETLLVRLGRLVSFLDAWNASGSSEIPYRFDSDPDENRRLALTAAVLASAPTHWQNQFVSLFLDSITEDSLEILALQLQTLGWLRPQGILQRSLAQAIHQAVYQHVKESIQGDFTSDSSFRNEILSWKQEVLNPWLVTLLGDDAFGSQGWEDRLTLICAEGFCLVRMDEIFDMVADYPDSHSAITELRNVLEVTKMYDLLGEHLNEALVRRLNHPGANTSQIIDMYIATIKVLRIIDPSDRLLTLVAEPVRNYLRGRQDTVRCIITSLTDAEIGGDLYEELRRQDAKPLENIVVDSDDEEEPPDMNWQPPPSIFKPKGTFLEGTGARVNGGTEGDILAMLVSIYGSKELFVNEYRIMLAEKLLQNVDYNTDKEVHTLELLKLRFGELSMRNCEIMIKDMDDSKRANNLIQSSLRDTVVDAVQISHIFWPALQSSNESLKHHPRLQSLLDSFGSAYGKLKNPRRLVWLHQRGTVDLELDVIEDNGCIKKKNFSCSPLLATLISHFEDKASWTAEELSNETGLPEHVVQKRMTFWVNQRIIRVLNQSNYELLRWEEMIENGDTAISADHHHHHDEDEYAVSVSVQEEEEMEVYLSYIVGMLTNLGQLSLKTIHNNLKTFVTGSDIQYNKSPQQLSAFLQHLVKQEKLECGPDGMYKLFRK